MFQGKEYIYEVYKQKSFSKAAANLYISQPSLSATVKKIENQIGFPIFDRSSNPIGLTESGQKYILYIEQIMDMEAEFDSFNKNLTTLKTGYLAIGGTNLFSSYVLPPLLTEFMEAYPQIEVKLIEDSTNALERQLFDGTLDMIVDNCPLNPKVYDRTYYDSEEILLAVPRNFSINDTLKERRFKTEDILNDRHLDPLAPTVSIKHFKDCPFVLQRSGNDTHQRSSKIFKNAAITPKVLLELDQQVTAYHIACFGMGISFVSDTLLKHVPADPRIYHYKIKDPVVKRNLYFYHKHKKYTKRAMEAFLNIACKKTATPV